MTTTDMGVVAVRQALEDAKIWRGGFQAAFCADRLRRGGVRSQSARPTRHDGDMPMNCRRRGGLREWWRRTRTRGHSIRSGQIDTALVFGIEKMPRGIIRSSFFEPLQEASGLASTPSYFRVFGAQRPCILSGMTKQHNRGCRCQEPQARNH